MELKKFEKVKDGNYLKNYELTYVNKQGNEKKYEIVSRKELKEPNDIGKRSSGVSIVATKEDKLLLLKEFRMGVNCYIYNLVAGMIEDDETIEECVERELYEESGLQVKKIIDILEPSFAAVAISDTKTQIIFIEAEGEISDHTSENEEITANFYTKEEVRQLLKTKEFSSRCQVVSYFFSK